MRFLDTPRQKWFSDAISAVRYYVVRDVWESPARPEIEGKRDVLQYMNELKTRLTQVQDESMVSTNKILDEYKKYYNRHSADRKLKICDKVLVMMPNCSSKMFAQWMGEYPVIRCLDNYHYEIQMERRKVMWHINSLKRFIERDARVGEVLNAQEDDEEDAHYPTSHKWEEGAKRFNMGDHLDGMQKRKLLEVL